ncbi:MAG: hypothetical protein A2Y63_00225 [Candidatus Riflebacteria bacterium RBG_13_59_9]|nr:MAG: hypothetical protein A2Y63_00225 [Candidatus Riflebacteria bacterium RBG_13_59_9]
MWPGWAKRRAALLTYFSGVLAGSVLFTLYLRFAHPHYESVQFQLLLLQYAFTAVVFLWFVPGLARDYSQALHSSGLRNSVSSLAESLWRLMGSILMLAALTAASLMPLALLFPVYQVVGSTFYTTTFLPPWGIYVLIANLVLAAYLVGTIALCTSLFLLVRSLTLYRLIVAAFLVYSLLDEAARQNLFVLVGWPISQPTIGSVYGFHPLQYLFVLDFPGYFSYFVTTADTGSLISSSISLPWLRVTVEIVWRLLRSLIQLLFFLWLAASINAALWALVRRRGGPLLRPRPVAHLWLGFLTSVGVLGIVTVILLYSTSLPLSTLTEQSGVAPYDLLLLALICAIAYMVVVAAVDAARSASYSGLGNFLPAVVRRFHYQGLMLILSIVSVGACYLLIFVQVAGYSVLVFIGGIALLLLSAVVLMLGGTAVIALGRLTSGFWGLWSATQGWGLALLLAAWTFFFFLPAAPEKLVGATVHPAADATAQVAEEAARLGSSTYSALVHAWLRSFEATATSSGAVWQLFLGTAAGIVALVLVLALLARLTRRLA